MMPGVSGQEAVSKTSIGFKVKAGKQFEPQEYQDISRIQNVCPTLRLSARGGFETASKKNEGGKTVNYINDECEVIDGSLVKYVFAGNLRVAKIVGGVVTYFHKDHLGSSTVMTDGSGNVVESGAYLPYGGQRGSSSITGTGYTFTDQELDGESGLFNYDARLYDPVVGLFLSADTVVPDWYDPQALNRYAYVRNNPLKYNDPSGHIFETIWDAANVVMDVVSLADNLSQGNWGSAAVDVGCLVADVGATLTPFAPGGAGTIAKTTRMAAKATGAVDTVGDVAKVADNIGDGVKTAKKAAKKGLKPTAHSVEQKINRGVRSVDELDAVKNPLKVNDVKVDKLGRPSQQIIGEKATVVVNPENKNMVSTWPTSTKKAAKLKNQ